jgi:hypothetical protein
MRSAKEHFRGKVASGFPLRKCDQQGEHFQQSWNPRSTLTQWLTTPIRPLNQSDFVLRVEPAGPNARLKGQDVMDIHHKQERDPMFRKTALAIAATAVIGAASLTPASAHHFGFGHFGWGGVGFGLGVLGAAAIASSTYAVDTSCWQYQYVQTPRGYYRKVLVNVCQ